MTEPDKSKIDNLRDILYSRKIKIKPNFVLDLNAHKNDISEKWQGDDKPEEKQEEVGDNSDISKKIFWFAFIFFIISACIAGYVYLKGGNVISANNIKIEVIGPTTIKAGEDTVLDVSVTNYNDTTLEVADLILEYPKGTRSAVDKETPMTHDRVAFGDIAPNETVRKTVKAIMFGEEGKPAHIDMTLEYRIPTAMSVFTKETSYEVIIGSTPLTLSVVGLKEINSNQDYELTLNVTSNSADAIKGVVVTGELPFGFEPRVLSPEPLAKTYTWDLGSIEAGGKRVITLKGKMYGDKNEERYFKFNVGTKDDSNINQVNGVIANVVHPVSIREPFLGISLYFDRSPQNSLNYVARSGGVVSGTIEILNNLPVPVYDGTVELKIDGKLVTQSSIKPAEGFYDSNIKTIKWDRFYTNGLENIAPNNKNVLSFLFSTERENTELALNTHNPEVSLDVTVRGKRRLESGVPEEIISTIHRVIKLSSDPHMYSAITHTTGPIENQGEIPPTVGNKTEYTVTWTVTNNFNNLSGAKIKTILPGYVKWTNVVSPQTEKVTYNSDSREIVWDLGNVNTQTDGKLATRNVSFQLAITPSQSQVQTVPIMVNFANFTAHDTFTNKDLSDSNDILSTELPTDPAYGYGDAAVK